MTEWIKVKDKLPDTFPWSNNCEMSKKVIVRGEGKYQYPWVAHFKREPDSGYEIWIGGYEMDNFKITEWMSVLWPE